MGLSVIASNTSIKISAAIDASGTNNGTNDTDTLYTCPANSYAIVQLTFNEGAGGAATFKIDTNPIITAINNTFNGQVDRGGTYGMLTNVFIGPSQVLSVTWIGASTNATCRVTGVEFTNSP